MAWHQLLCYLYFIIHLLLKWTTCSIVVIKLKKKSIHKKNKHYDIYNNITKLKKPDRMHEEVKTEIRYEVLEQIGATCLTCFLLPSDMQHKSRKSIINSIMQSRFRGSPHHVLFISGQCNYPTPTCKVFQSTACFCGMLVFGWKIVSPCWQFFRNWNNECWGPALTVNLPDWIFWSQVYTTPALSNV